MRTINSSHWQENTDSENILTTKLKRDKGVLVSFFYYIDLPHIEAILAQGIKKPNVLSIQVSHVKKIKDTEYRYMAIVAKIKDK